jgi:hypothetical protein
VTEAGRRPFFEFLVISSALTVRGTCQLRAMANRDDFRLPKLGFGQTSPPEILLEFHLEGTSSCSLQTPCSSPRLPTRETWPCATPEYEDRCKCIVCTLRYGVLANELLYTNHYHGPWTATSKLGIAMTSAHVPSPHDFVSDCKLCVRFLTVI